MLACVVALCAAAPARAAVLTVNRLDDHTPDACDAGCTIRDAITAAEVSADADTIVLPAGTIALSEGPLTITRPVTTQGAPERTTLDPTTRIASSTCPGR